MCAGILILCALAGATPGKADQPAAPPAFPGWLSGGWLSQSPEGKWTEEWWTPAKAGVMLGAGRSGTGDKLEWWEQTRIKVADGKLRFCALPKGQAGACFAATKVEANEIVFENPGHDFPNKVAYRREGSDLLAEISGTSSTNLQRWRFRRIN